MKRLLVTGATGYIGQAVMRTVAGASYNVHGVSRRPISPAAPNILMHKVNLLNTDSVDALFGRIRPSYLLHLAWDVSGSFYSSDTNRAWLRASKHLIDAFQKNGGRRAVMAGTCVEYDVQHGYCVEGQTPCAPQTLYGQCKHELHQYSSELSESAEFDVAWLRIFSSFGPGEANARLVPAALQALRTNNPLDVSDGSQVRDYLHVYDVAAACLAVLQSDVTGAVNICSGRPVQVADVLLHLADLFNSHHLIRWGTRPRRPTDPPFIAGSNARLLDETDWLPLFSLESGLRHVVAHATNAD